MVTSIEIPDNYGYVLLTAVVGQFVVGTAMGGKVMTRRKELDVPLPNMYGTPGVHKNADEFNRIQRGHQNMFESLGAFTVMALVGGLKYPIVCSVSSVMYLAGCYLYQLGYADISSDIAAARHKKGGPIKYLGYLGVLGSTISLAGNLNKW
eukprot:CAMPEP_0198142822 /NCGR_PEP_ID=MMETSP1443-20131203/5503_1 /TAXON_ID=186043 /ORGANISM="Entomoneis sp., Strain CCMP2396" /LENGTH=150 /DNA_ID=CAMNT_0043805917 /DNA_START=84 /DNA_END=533 /DNA_ORIENTATION=-